MNALAMWLDGTAEIWWPQVLHAAWQAALVGLLLCGLVRWGRRWPAPLRYGLLVVALAKFVVPPSVAAPVGLFSRLTPAVWLGVGDRPNVDNRIEPHFDDRSLHDEHRQDESAPAGSLTEVANGVGDPADVDRSAPPSTTTVAFPESMDDPRASNGTSAPLLSIARTPLRPIRLGWKAWLMLVHLLGAVALACWTLWQLHLLGRVVRGARAITHGPQVRQLESLCRTLRKPRVPRLLESPAIASPAALGIWRPTVMVPTKVLDRLSDRDVETVLAHELAHLRRGDVWINWLQIVLGAAWWFHPVFWLVSRALRRVREDCCDDLILAKGVTAQSDYCDALLRVASKMTGGVTVGATLGMAHRLHPLAQRLTRIMDGTLPRRTRLSMTGLFGLVVLACLLLPGLNRDPPDAAQADEPGAAAADTARSDEDDGAGEPDAAVSGVVLDAADQPVAGATVWLLTGDFDSAARRRAGVVTDSAGRFQLRGEAVDRWFHPGVPAQRTLLSRDANGRIGWLGALGFNAPQTVRLRLRDVAELRGKLLDRSGTPIAGAHVTPLRFASMSQQFSVPVRGELFGELMRELAADSAADGSFVLRHMPGDAILTATISAAGFGEPRVRWELGDTVTLRLERAGAISGALLAPGGVSLATEGLATKIELQLWRQADKSLDDGAPFELMYSASATAADDGSFAFGEVPPGRYTITPRIGADVPLYGDPTEPFEVAPGEAASDVILPLGRSITVRGQVVDRRDGEPVAGVEVQIYGLQDGGFRFPGPTKSTDADGRFTAYARPGTLTFQAMKVPEGFLASLDMVKLEPVVADGDIEPVIEIERAIQVEGVVVDRSGQPVPDAEFHILLPNRGRRHFFPRLDRADARGRFVLKDIDPADTLPLRARTATAVTDGPVLLTPAQLKQPIRLVVDKTYACRLRGRLIDEAGAPVPNVKVMISSTRMYQSLRVPQIGTSVGVGNVETGNDGRFESTALWPGDTYQATVALEGYTRAESARVSGKAGEASDLGTIVLRRNDAFVAGRVVDSAGRPLVGVKVFNSGDGLQPLGMVTKAGGRFRLEGLFRGPVYVFARKAGYRFTGVRVAANSETVEVMLPRSDEPPPTAQPAAPPADASDHQQLACWMMERLWELPQRGDKWLLVRRMARIDREQAARWSAQLGGEHDEQIAIGVAERLDDESRQVDLWIDPDKAIASLAGLSDERMYNTLESLTEQTMAHSPENALRFALEALPRVRELGPPSRIASMARLGDLLVRLGLTEAGQELLEEAANAAEQLGANARQWHARGSVAVALGKYDLPRAKKLLEPIVHPHERPRWLSLLAESLAEHDLEAALAVAEEIEGDANAAWTQNRAKLKISYRIAAARPAEALRIVDAMTGDGSAKTQAEALGWIALALAPTDRRAAHLLIDRSLAIYLDRPEAFQSLTNYGGRPALAAWIARQAREVGYTDMDSVVMRILATRPTMREEYDPIRRLEATVAMAAVLGFSVPETSRQLLEAAEPTSELIGSGHSSIQRGDWIEAWSLADPEHAKQIFLHELDAVKDNPDLDLQHSGLLYAADLLSRPRSQWPRHWRERFSVFWYPGEE